MAWRRDVGCGFDQFAVAGGVAAVICTQSLEGQPLAVPRLVVVGETQASIGLQVHLSSRFPAPGKEVRVDLDATKGIQGKAREFSVDWGDGEVEPWQNSSTFSHRYSGLRDYEARFMARNDAGQVTVRVETLYVGASPPLTPLQKLFSPENQNLTFFAIGLAVTLLGAAYGLYRVRHGRRIVQRELRAIDAAAASAAGDPSAVQREMEARRQHVHELVVAGRLLEGQHALLAERIRIHEHRARIESLDERFDFLPHGFVRRLKEALSDGRLAKWEHSALLRLLEAEPLSAREKQLARKALDALRA
jgi:hypothetical protein